MKDWFPQTKTLSLFGYLDLSNVNKATKPVITELGELLGIDGFK